MCISKFEVTERNVLRVANLSTFQWNMKCFEMLKKSADYENNDTECPITKFWSTCHELPSSKCIFYHSQAQRHTGDLVPVTHLSVCRAVRKWTWTLLMKGLILFLAESHYSGLAFYAL